MIQAVVRKLFWRKRKEDEFTDNAIAHVDKLKIRFPDASSWQLEIIRASEPFHPTTPERILALSDASRFLIRNQVDGDFVECGLFRGQNMAAIAKTLKHMRADNRKIWLYECGNEVSPTIGEDVESNRATVALSPSAQRSESASLDKIRLAIAEAGYANSKVHFVQASRIGNLFNDKPHKIALLKLESEWYETTKHQLEQLFPLLVPGGVLIIDDYGRWDGCRRAVDEYFEQNQICMLLNRIDNTARIGIHWPRDNMNVGSTGLRRHRAFREAG